MRLHPFLVSLYIGLAMAMPGLDRRAAGNGRAKAGDHHGDYDLEADPTSYYVRFQDHRSRVNRDLLPAEYVIYFQCLMDTVSLLLPSLISNFPQNNRNHTNQGTDPSTERERSIIHLPPRSLSSTNHQQSGRTSQTVERQEQQQQQQLQLQLP